MKMIELAQSRAVYHIREHDKDKVYIFSLNIWESCVILISLRKTALDIEHWNEPCYVFCSLQRYKMPTFKLVSAAPRFEITFHNGRDHYDNVMSLILRFSSFDVFLVMQNLSLSLISKKLQINADTAQTG